jgi:hypothetical protein
MYRQLDPAKIVDTAFVIAQRVAERFPKSGLSGVAVDLTAAAKDASSTAASLSRPNVPLRTAVIVLSLIFVASIAVALYAMRVSTHVATVTELAQGIESSINDVLFAGVAIWFLASIEGRIKRRRALQFLAQLRSLAHVIDMHQLTKDPGRLATSYESTQSSPTLNLTPAGLVRYLDYCSEMLAIISKLSALLVQDFEDPTTLAAVNELEELASGLQRKVWQKIMIVGKTKDEN